MTRGRILPLFGLGGVGYALAYAASQSPSFELTDMVSCAVAVGCGCVPLWLHRFESPGRMRAGWLAVAGGLILVSTLVKSTSLAMEYVLPLAWSLWGALILDLALTVPRPTRKIKGLSSIRAFHSIVALLAAGIGILAAWPVVSTQGGAWFLSARASAIPSGYALSCLVCSVGIRFWRRAKATTPLESSANTRALLGLLVACVALLPFVLGRLTFVWRPLAGSAWSLALVWAVLSVTVCHALLVDRRQKYTADLQMRKALAVVIALTLSGVMIVLGRSLIPREPIALLVLALTWLSMSGLIYYLAYAAVRFWIRPFHGRLLDEINEVKRELCHSTSLEALASTVLNKFRKASGDLKAEPVLWTLDPEWELRIDGAGFGRVEQRGAPRALREAVCAQPHETFVRSQLELLRIRRPDLREVIQSLVDMDALCALPLVYEGEVNGILLIPRGRRRSPLSFEELNALQELMASMASVLGMLADHYTAHERYKNERILREQLQEQLHKAHEEIAQWRKSNTVLRRHRAFQAWDWPLVMHSDDMKEVERHMDVFAPLDVPVLIQAYSFREALTVAQAMHDKSAFKEGPFVVADCGLVGPEFARTALFGDPSCETDLAAWVALARHGTLVLKDVVALPIEVQEELASFMAERKHSSGRLLEFRVVATIREPLSELVNTKRLASSLVQRLRSQVLEIPSLALRQEDMPTLVLAALDRAIHRTGRATMGLEAGVLERLRMHSWPGDVEELETVITNAVLRAEGDMLRVDDVAFYGDTVQSLDGDPYFGTYASLEQQILQKAIERAGGNKSEAARALGLKRTTFIDKLRRFNLEDMDSENAGEHAA